MRRQISVYTLFILILFSSCSSIKKKSWTDDDIIDSRFTDFATEVDEYLTSKKFQGTVLVGKNQEIIFAKGYGKTDRKDEAAPKININTTFEAGSITKQLTAAAVMQLVQTKKISLDDKLSDFFPKYTAGNNITIRMLLNMRSGLVDFINSPDEFFPRNVFNEIERKTIANQPLDENIVLQHFYDAPVLAKPDSTYFYCNTNYYLLAKIIEQVSGMSYEQYIQKNILDKCGMTNSNLDFQKTDTRGYDYKGRYYSIPASLSLGCGDLNTNVTDLFKWNTQFAEGKIIKKKTFQQMIDTESYGFGVYRRENIIFHSGTTNVFNSYNLYDLDEKVSIIVLVNRPISEINATFIAGNIQKIWNDGKEIK